MLRTLLIDVAPKQSSDDECFIRMEELEHLVDTYGWLVIDTKIQRKDGPDFLTYVGKWKLEEIIVDMWEKNIPLLIVNNILKPKQMYTINERLRVIKVNGAHPQCWDRVDLILKIFERHATNSEAKLQIELAAIKHMWPRIFGMGMELSRQGWSSGKTSGIGETNTEIMRRHLKNHQLSIRKKLKEYEQNRSLHRNARLRKQLLTVGIVWYTNAGKSCLMKALTKKDVLIENKLFATLWTSVGKMVIDPSVLSSSISGDHQISYKPIEILVNDTIWFIRHLPPQLIDAFRSTLEDSIESQLLLHVIDATDPHMTEKIRVVDDILSQIKALQPRLYVFNKVDQLSTERQQELWQRFAHLSPLWVSGRERIWLDILKQTIAQKLYQ